ncbi:hypothetical protein BD310DRAFT_932095 [Dichomitus squalens]|uniref:Uncharacterized protein n=1 Tax=Dichomitus squalens TaxID=114155 RepID=A0A4Q9PPB4_9APHY|nr:hypothetical protein BD310DRAFT_932095 [Dichomitus squalens]
MTRILGYNSINGLSLCQPCPEPSLAKPPSLDAVSASPLYHPLQRTSSATCPLGSDVCESCQDGCSY